MLLAPTVARLAECGGRDRIASSRLEVEVLTGPKTPMLPALTRWGIRTICDGSTQAAPPEKGSPNGAFECHKGDRENATIQLLKRGASCRARSLALTRAA